jgi:hypothetical protein
MAQNTTVSVSANTWTQLTDADVVNITFQNISSNFVLIKATADTSAPTDKNGAVRYNPGQGERFVAVSDLFPGVAGADRVWAWAEENSIVMVSHA